MGNLSQELFDAGLKRALEHEARFGPAKQAANGVAEMANLIAEYVAQGRTAFLLSDIASLEERIAILKAALSGLEK